MAIGDPWDTSYNPKYRLKNKHTGEPVWAPDASDDTAQDSPLTIKNRRKGRFCTEGCGCIDTGCSNLSDGACKLPPEIAVTIYRGPDGRYTARSDIANGEGETFHLKYSNGSWRGSRCCSQNVDGSLQYACDPCKVTTLPNGKPSECHYANNKYKSLDSQYQYNDDFPARGDYNYQDALQGEVWPRRGVDALLQPDGYGQTLTPAQTEMLGSGIHGGYANNVCYDQDGRPDYAPQTKADCQATHGERAVWSILDPIWKNNDKSEKDEIQAGGGKNSPLIGTKLETTQFDDSVDHARINIKTVEKRVSLDAEGYLVGYSIDNGSPPDTSRSDELITYSVTSSSVQSGCIEDGAIPIKKRPWCRNSITGKRIQQECSDLQYKHKLDGEAGLATWLYGD